MMPNNPFQGNPTMGQIQIQQQQQQQMGMINPPPNQIVCNGNLTIPNRPPFMNVPNQFFPLQNVMRPSGQFFGPQNPNSAAMNNQLMNSPQPGGGNGGQFFAHNPMNPIIPYNTQNLTLPNTQFHSPLNTMIPYNNQNVTLPNGGQFCLQNPNQNMVQFVQMQIPNYAQVVPGNMQLFQNQVAHGMPPQNPNFPGNQQFGMPHSSGTVQHGNQQQQKLISPTMNMTATNQSPNTGAQGNSTIQQNFGTVQPQQAQNFRPPGFTKPQGNLGNNNVVNNVNTKGKSSYNKNFTRHPKNGASQGGMFKPQFHHKQNGQRKTRFHDQHRGKGYKNDGSTKFDDANSTIRTRVERKPLHLSYTKQEIQQWREARKKNYPSKANMEKMVAERDAKLRRQQLKEILAKQAELGCEVAEIPSSYLSDSEQGHQKEGNKREWGEKGRLTNKFNKRGRSHRNERFTKKQKSRNVNNDENSGFTMKQQHLNKDYTARPPVNKKEPTLLQKLLAADISRDKSHLLQVFRFMVVNSFFKDWPEKPLRFPSIIINETGAEGEMVGEKASPVENTLNDGDDDDNNDSGERNAQAHGGGKNFSRAAEGCGEKEVVEPEEEEGEIID